MQAKRERRKVSFKNDRGAYTESVVRVTTLRKLRLDGYTQMVSKSKRRRLSVKAELLSGAL